MTRTDSRRHATSRILAVLFVCTVGAMAAFLVPVTSGNTSQASATSATTVTSELHSWTWDPTHPTRDGSLDPNPRSVTVDQTESLVSQVVRVSWKDFSSSSTSNSVGPGNYPVHVYECDNADPQDPGDCFGDSAFGDTHPGYGSIGDQTNFVQTFTSADGTGEVDFDVLTGADNPALGCSPGHDCSLVVVPWAGGRPTTSVGGQDCSNHSLDTKVQRGDGNWASPAGLLLNRGCDWAARIVVPLKFAPTPLNCPARDADLSTEGSPMLRRAIDQWRAGVCNGGGGKDPLQVQYTGLSEYQARSDFDRNAVDVGLTSQPAEDPTRKLAYAPVAVSSIAIAYYIDDRRTGKPITKLTLSPRLVAKMLTQSYTDNLNTSDDGACATSGSAYGCAPEVAGNPASIYDDPEFIQLNPGYTRSDFPFVSQGASSPNVVYGLSDNTHQLTSWLHADKGAADFLAGKKDPWGMHVNDAYLPSVSPTYPIDSFNANDLGHTLTVDPCGNLEPYGDYSCAVGGLQNNWFPINGLDNVARATVNGKNTAKLYRPVCDGNSPPIRGVCSHYVGASAQPLGTRSIFAIVSGGDNAAFKFPTAQLTTSSALKNTTTDLPTVALSDESMSAALGVMKTNPDGTTQALDYAKGIGDDAYPLTTVNYAMVPTCGLTADRASAVSAFLDYAASDTANTPGVLPGQLAPGYLPMTAAMRARTHAVAGTTATEQACTSGGGSTTSSGSTGTTSSGASHGSGSGHVSAPGGTPGGNPGVNNPGGGNAGPVGNNPGPTSPSASGSGSATTSGTSSAPASSPSTTPAAYRLPGSSAGAPAFFLPVALCIGAALLLTGPAIVVVNRRGGLLRKGDRVR